MTEGKVRDFPQAKQALAEGIARFSAVVPYLVEDISDQIGIVLLAGRLKLLTEIILRSTVSQPSIWDESARAINFAIDRMEQLIETLEYGFIADQVSEEKEFSDIDFANFIIEQSRENIEEFIFTRAPLEVSTRFYDINRLLGGNETSIPIDKNTARLIKQLIQVVIGLINKGEDQKRLTRIIKMIAIVLEAIDQKIEGASSLKTENKGECLVSINIVDGYIDNIDISKDWKIIFRVHGERYEINVSASSIKVADRHHFDSIEGTSITSFIKGKCGEEIDIEIAISVEEILGLSSLISSPSKGQAQVLAYKVNCPGAKWGKHAIATVVSGAKTSKITVEPLIVLSCVHPDQNGGDAKGF